MTNNELQQQSNTLASLNKALQDCVASQDIEKAIDLATQRQKALMEVFESAEYNTSNSANLEELVAKTLECLSQEKVLVKAQSSKKRNDFLLRKSAIKAYMAPVAA